MKVGLMSDTHGFLDEALFEYFGECDEIWHAGDFGSIEVLQQLEAFRRVRGVSGNVDGAPIRAAVPEELEWDCEGMRVYMTHIAVKKEVIRRKPNLFVCGHSHILKVARESGYLYMNPGACGHNGWHKVRTALRFRIEAGKVSDVMAIELGPRGRKGTMKKP